MSTFITRLDEGGDGPRVAVKDLIDVAGCPTTAGCLAVERRAAPARADAACLAGIRAAGCRLVGKANLHELALSPLGTNPWYGTPVNPLDPALIPGGSSSGSAVAVGEDEADVALGTDTGGSVRIPAACCGVTGLKTTHGRVPLEGVWPVSPGLDTVGPMALDVAGVLLGMQLLEPGFTPGEAAGTVGRIRTASDPALEAAVDRALAEAGFEVVALDWDEWDEGNRVFLSVFPDELWEADGEVVTRDPDGVGPDVRAVLSTVEAMRGSLAPMRAGQDAWRSRLLGLFDRVEVLALPTLPCFAPRLEALTGEDLDLVSELTRHTIVANAAGLPATAQPVPAAGRALPASLQLVGPPGGEERLVSTAARVEAAVS
jgi:amidase